MNNAMTGWLMFLALWCYGQVPSINTQIQQAEKMMLSDPQSSFDLAEKILNIGQPGRKDQLRLLFVLTNTSGMLQHPLEVVKYGNEALAIAGVDDGVIKIKILGILGNTYQSIQLNEKTRIYLDEAESLLSSSKIPDSLSYIRGNIYYLKAMNYSYSLDRDIALSYFDKSISQYLSSRHPLAEINLKLAYLNKAFALIDRHNLKQARESFQLASVHLKESARPYPPQFVALQEAFITLGMAKIYSIEKNTALSNDLLLKLLDERKNAPVRADIENEVYEILAQNYLQTGEIKKHEYYQDLYLKSEMTTHQNASVWVNKLMAQEQLSDETQRHKTLTKYIIFIVVSVLFFVITAIYLRLKQVKIKQKRDSLEKQVLDYI